jgi:hypothetical protein
MITTGCGAISSARITAPVTPCSPFRWRRSSSSHTTVRGGGTCANSASSAGPAGCTSHQSGSSAPTASTAHRVFPTEEPPTSSTNPPRWAVAATLARTPNSAGSTSRGTYSGRTSSGTPGTLIAACTPSRRGSASPTRTLAAGPASAEMAWARLTSSETTPARRCVSSRCAARHRSSSSIPAGPLSGLARPRAAAAARTIRTTIRTLPMSCGKRLPRSQSPIVVGDTPAALAKARSAGSPASDPALNTRSSSSRVKNSPLRPGSPLLLITPLPCPAPVQPTAGHPAA